MTHPKITPCPKKGLFKWLLLAAVLLSLVRCNGNGSFPEKPGPEHDLVFPRLATSWDEGIPLGNGMLGALLWEKDGKLRISLDRADLWDLRPMENMQGDRFRFDWVIRQVWKDNYRAVQEQFDVPYSREPAPTKIPAAALEWDLRELGTVKSVRLHLDQALCEITWESGARLLCFVHATEPVGWIALEGAGDENLPELDMPDYHFADSRASMETSRTDLRRLGYPAGQVRHTSHSLTGEQEGWGGMDYQVQVEMSRSGKKSLTAAWSVSRSLPGYPVQEPASSVAAGALERGFEADLRTHRDWWGKYWAQSSVSLPDSVLEKQWYLEQYKFGAASRRGAPPIALQGVWTADNGQLPPWKGDFHHDLNTELSYWSCYSANHLEEGLAFPDWLWETRQAAARFAREYFGTGGWNMPGVTTLTSEPMGGWIQYSFSPTTGAWLAQHFYLHWRYSMDTVFLAERAYPYLQAVAQHLEELAQKDPSGMLKLPLSSSPEINDNSIHAWFMQTTNYDLALIRWLVEKTSELAGVLGKQQEADHYLELLSRWPGLSVSARNGALEVAPGISLPQSHRHFSHLMAIHPLGLIDLSHGESDSLIIQASLHELDSLGPDQWTGYSYSWLGNLEARAGNGDRAAEALRIFSTCFCLPNSFHVNGDQSGTGKSGFTYRPFTLEGNFAFAAGIQEMLIQSHTGTIRLFPAIPADWKDVSFRQLRAEGAFLVSARMEGGMVRSLEVIAEKGGVLRLADPFGKAGYTGGEMMMEETDGGSPVLVRKMEKGEVLHLSMKNEPGRSV